VKITFNTLCEKEVNEAVSYLQSIGMVPIDIPQVAVSVTETVPEEPNEVEVIPEPTPKPKRASKPKAEPKKETGITLADLKESAKNAVTRSSREDVKKTIGEFAEKLVEVKEADYGKLYKKLQELGA